MRSIAILGEFNAANETHVATQDAIAHSSKRVGVDVNVRWVGTDDYDESLFDRHAGIWIAPGSPYRNFDNALRAIRFAREHQLPCLGTCGGFQHMIIEYARNVLSIGEAQHAEYDPEGSNLFISGLYCSLVGRRLDINLTEGSQVARMYGVGTATEQYYCNFGVNPEYVPLLKNGPLQISGSDAEGEVRIIELTDHPFFIGTLFVPQARSTVDCPHPLVNAFLQAALQSHPVGV